MQSHEKKELDSVYIQLQKKLLELSPAYAGEEFQPLTEKVNTLMLTDFDSNYGYQQLGELLIKTSSTLISSIEPEAYSPDLVRLVLKQTQLQLDLAEFFYWQAINGHRVSKF